MAPLARLGLKLSTSYRGADHSPRRVLRKCVEQCSPQRWRPTNGSRTPGGVGLRALSLAGVRGHGAHPGERNPRSKTQGLDGCGFRD